MGRVPLSQRQSSWKLFPNTTVPPTTLKVGFEAGTEKTIVRQIVSEAAKSRIWTEKHLYCDNIVIILLLSLFHALDLPLTLTTTVWLSFTKLRPREVAWALQV